MNIKPMGDRLLVQFAEKDKVSKGGLLLPEAAQEKHEVCTILKVGPEVKSKELKPGINIIVQHYAGTDIKADNESMTIVRECDCIAIVDNSIKEE